MTRRVIQKSEKTPAPDCLPTPGKTKGQVTYFALEVKATSDWNPNDSNRRVITSSSEKIRKQFSEPIHHLLFTLLYKIETGFAVIEHMRLDFLEPTTPVSVRLEASVNHKLLSHGTPASFVI